MATVSAAVRKQRKIWREKTNAWRDKNREAWNEYQAEYKRERYANDEEYRERMKAYQRERYRKVKLAQAKKSRKK